MERVADKLETHLFVGLNGDVSELTPADWSAIRKEALAKVESRKHAR